MQYNQVALNKKMLHLDEIEKYPNVLTSVLQKNIKGKYTITQQERRWIGGGSTTYVIDTEQGKFFLKVKHRDVTVESKLEEEKDFIGESCIEHEKRMIEKACNVGVRTPKIVFFDEKEEFQFLAVEHITKSFEEALEEADIEQITRIWNDLLKNIRILYENGIVHTDIHEMNLRVDGDKIVIIDFEEARELNQNTVFEKSLDYVGRNEKSVLGEFPLADEQSYTIRLNSLLRMRQVFKKYLIPLVGEYIQECNYDSSNGICIAIDHGYSELTYQSIQNEWFSVKGQREQRDKRPKLIWSIMKKLDVVDGYTLIDVGSNNGLFCREISKYSDGKVRGIGLEGFHKFNVLAKALTIIEDCDNVEYYDFLCGQDSFDNLNLTNNCFMTICSVWHHIQDKKTLLLQLKKIDVKYILLEMPVQEECYEGHTWEVEIQSIKETLDFKGEVLLGYSHDYHRPLVLLSKNEFNTIIKKALIRLAKKKLNPGFFEVLLRHIMH